MKLQKSDLQTALEEFDRAVNTLAETSPCTPDCTTPQKCERAGLCLHALQQANLQSLRYLSVLDKIERISGAVPKEQTQQYLQDADQCLSIIHKMNKGGCLDVSNYAQQIATRRNLVRTFNKH